MWLPYFMKRVWSSGSSSENFILIEGCELFCRQAWHLWTALKSTASSRVSLSEARMATDCWIQVFTERSPNS